jgi:hypothetical protein
MTDAAAPTPALPSNYSFAETAGNAPDRPALRLFLNLQIADWYGSCAQPSAIVHAWIRSSA